MRFRNLCFLILFFSFRATTALGIGESWSVDLATCEHQVEFDLIGFPDVISVFGAIKKKGDSILNGQFLIEKRFLSGSAEIGMETSETGIAKQDSLMKKTYLETDKWKTAKFTLQRVKLPFDFSSSHYSGKQIPFEGTLLLHGTNRKISGTVDLESGENNIMLRFLFDLNLPDYGIAIPKYFGLSLTGNVQVSAAVQGKLKRSPAQNETMP